MLRPLYQARAAKLALERAEVEAGVANTALRQKLEAGRAELSEREADKNGVAAQLRSATQQLRDKHAEAETLRAAKAELERPEPEPQP